MECCCVISSSTCPTDLELSWEQRSWRSTLTTAGNGDARIRLRRCLPDQTSSDQFSVLAWLERVGVGFCRRELYAPALFSLVDAESACTDLLAYASVYMLLKYHSFPKECRGGGYFV